MTLPIPDPTTGCDVCGKTATAHSTEISSRFWSRHPVKREHHYCPNHIPTKLARAACARGLLDAMAMGEHRAPLPEGCHRDLRPTEKDDPRWFRWLVLLGVCVGVALIVAGLLRFA